MEPYQKPNFGDRVKEFWQRNIYDNRNKNPDAEVRLHPFGPLDGDAFFSRDDEFGPQDGISLTHPFKKKETPQPDSQPSYVEREYEKWMNTDYIREQLASGKRPVDLQHELEQLRDRASVSLGMRPAIYLDYIQQMVQKLRSTVQGSGATASVKKKSAFAGITADQIRQRLSKWANSDFIEQQLAAGISGEELRATATKLYDAIEQAHASGEFNQREYQMARQNVAMIMDKIHAVSGTASKRQRGFASSGVALITGNSIDMSKRQIGAWYSLATAPTYPKGPYGSDVLPSFEQMLREVKKHDVVNVGHRDEEIEEITEAQLDDDFDNKRLGEIEEITEAQLEDEQLEIEEIGLTEAQLEDNDTRRPEAWEGDDIKNFRAVHDNGRERAQANEAFYKANPEKTKGGAGTVSASSWKDKKKI